MSEIDDLRAAVAALEARVSLLEDHLEVTQLVAQYGPAVDSGSAEAAARLWTEDGIFDAVGAMEMQGRDQIAGMVRTQGHQDLIMNGCGHVLTGPPRDRGRGRGRGSKLRPQHPLGPRHERFWAARLSANTWRWVRTQTAGGWPSGSTPTSTDPQTGKCSRAGARASVHIRDKLP